MSLLAAMLIWCCPPSLAVAWPPDHPPPTCSEPPMRLGFGLDGTYGRLPWQASPSGVLKQSWVKDIRISVVILLHLYLYLCLHQCICIRCACICICASVFAYATVLAPSGTLRSAGWRIPTEQRTSNCIQQQQRSFWDLERSSPSKKIILNVFAFDHVFG